MGVTKVLEVETGIQTNENNFILHIPQILAVHLKSSHRDECCLCHCNGSKAFRGHTSCDTDKILFSNSHFRKSVRILIDKSVETGCHRHVSRENIHMRILFNIVRKEHAENGCSLPRTNILLYVDVSHDCPPLILLLLSESAIHSGFHDAI